MTLEEQKFPIGRFQKPEAITQELIHEWKADIAVFPSLLSREVEDLSNDQLNTPYREGGWTVEQVVNHCADSHMNALLRIKLALTEEKPRVTAYFEERWAELADSKGLGIEPALQMLKGIHRRWSLLLDSLSEEQLDQTYIHPDHGREVSIREVLALYSWHGKHHLAHVQMLKKKNSWN